MLAIENHRNVEAYMKEQHQSEGQEFRIEIVTRLYQPQYA